jgi:PEP-CTERM motif
MRRLLTPAAALVTLLFLTGTRASAGPIDSTTAQWSYNFTPGTFVSAGTPGAVQVSPGIWVNQVNAVPADAPGSGGISFTNEPQKAVTGSSDVVATNLRVFSSADPTTPDKISSGGTYSFALVVTDKASGDTAQLTFTGKLSGTFSAGNANVTNQFTGATVLVNGQPVTGQTVTLGAFNYTVTFPSNYYSPPGPPLASNAGSISAHVSISPASGPGGGPGPATVPEPSTLLLSGLGLALMGAAGWRKRRQALAA